MSLILSGFFFSCVFLLRARFFWILDDLIFFFTTMPLLLPCPNSTVTFRCLLHHPKWLHCPCDGPYHSSSQSLFMDCLLYQSSTIWWQHKQKHLTPLSLLLGSLIFLPSSDLPNSTLHQHSSWRALVQDLLSENFERLHSQIPLSEVTREGRGHRHWMCSLLSPQLPCSCLASCI